MTARLAAAGTLGDERLAVLFTAVYADYWHSIRVDAQGLARMTSLYDLDLGASVVALVDGEPVGVALLGVRGREGWVGGMGVVPDHRRRGLARALMQQLAEGARSRRVERLRLEVLEQNAPAISLYEDLGHERLRGLSVWTLEAPPDASPAESAAFVPDPSAPWAEAPWQRDVRTAIRMQEAGTELFAASTGSGDGVGRAVFGSGSGSGSGSWPLLAFEPGSVDEGLSLLRAPFAAGASSLFWLNGPAGGIEDQCLEAAGGRRLARQHEMALSL